MRRIIDIYIRARDLSPYQERKTLSFRSSRKGISGTKLLFTIFSLTSSSIYIPLLLHCALWATCVRRVNVLEAGSLSHICSAICLGWTSAIFYQKCFAGHLRVTCFEFGSAGWNFIFELLISIFLSRIDFWSDKEKHFWRVKVTWQKWKSFKVHLLK